MQKERYTAIVLAAGQGKRMGSSVHKQYLLLQGKPVLYYALKAFEESPVGEIILVVGSGEIDYCQKEIIEKYGFQKIKCIVEGGRERYHSVFCGLCAVEQSDYVLIHDGARPFLNQEIIRKSMEAAKEYQAAVVGMTVKDTIKIADEKTFAKSTPKREHIWMIQTPQAFSYPLIYQAYRELLRVEQNHSSEQESTICQKKNLEKKMAEKNLEKKSLLNGKKIEYLEENWEKIQVTDDAMVVELLSDVPVKLVEGSYQNIKITTPEDLKIGEAFLSEA